MSRVRSITHHLLPFLRWFDGYSRQGVQADFVSGLTVALVLIPQSMAYAQLADLPAYFGLYAAFLPPMIAALFGCSNQLATGPVAVVSLMTSTALAPLATAGSESFIAYAILLALLVGIFQFALGVLRLGMVVNFLSHPVVNGFTNAAAIIIATSQLSKLFGVEVDKAEHHYETVYNVIVAAVHHTHWPTLLLGLLAFGVMIVLRRINPRLPSVLIAVIVTTVISYAIGLENNRTTTLARVESPELRELAAHYNESLREIDDAMNERIRVTERVRVVEGEAGPHADEAIELHAEQAKLDVRVIRLRERVAELRAEMRDIALVAMAGADGTWRFVPPELATGDGERQGGEWHLKIRNRELDPGALVMMGGGAVVGTIPPGLPRFGVPKLDWGIMRDLFPMAIIISLLGFMEAISIAKAMADRTGQRLDASQELVGQGLANILGAFAQSYPVSGSFSRSAVNIQAGAVTGLSSVFSSLVVLVTLLFLTPLLYHLPQSVLAAIIMMAVIGLINVGGFIHAWKAQRYDGIISVISFVCTLAFAPHLDKGIIIGVILSLALYLLRNMNTRVEILARTEDGHYRSAARWGLETCRHVAVIRIHNSIIFANVNRLETDVLRVITGQRELRHVLIVGNGINEVDASGEVMLSFLVSKVRSLGMDISFSGLNDSVLDVFRRTHLYEKVGADHFYSSVAQAVTQIHRGTCLGSDEECPLLYHARPPELPPEPESQPADGRRERPLSG
jgi:SulP family sulfate permease